MKTQLLYTLAAALLATAVSADPPGQAPDDVYVTNPSLAVNVTNANVPVSVTNASIPVVQVPSVTSPAQLTASSCNLDAGNGDSNCRDMFVADKILSGIYLEGAVRGSADNVAGACYVSAKILDSSQQFVAWIGQVTVVKGRSNGSYFPLPRVYVPMGYYLSLEVSNTISGSNCLANVFAAGLKPD